jgi:hypothetical protein
MNRRASTLFRKNRPFFAGFHVGEFFQNSHFAIRVLETLGYVRTLGREAHANSATGWMNFAPLKNFFFLSWGKIRRISPQRARASHLWPAGYRVVVGRN